MSEATHTLGPLKIVEAKNPYAIFATRAVIAQAEGRAP